MSKEMLMNNTVKGLREKAKDLGVTGRWNMNKEELVDAILRAEKSGKVANEDQSAKANTKVDDHKSVEIKDKAEKKLINTVPNLEEKKVYVDNAAIGTLVAFRLSNGKVKSAKIIKKSTSKRRFMLETVYGAQYIISFDDVIWVRTGKRWPRGVYELLKGGESVERRTM